MKTLFRIFNVMFFAAALVFAGASMVFAAPTQNIDWCDYNCKPGEMWNPNENQCEQCKEAGYNSDTCTCQCEPDHEYIPGIGCRRSWEWCEFDCEQYNGTWDPLTHSCSGSEKCYGEDQYYDEETCECACEDGVYNPTIRQCEPDPKLCNGKCTAPNFWNEDTKRCEMCVSIPGVSYYDPGSCQCRCTQDGYEYDAANGTCVSDGGGSGQTCQAGYYWEPGNQICKPCDIGFYNDTPGAASCTMCPGGRTTSNVGATTCDEICGNADHVASWDATDVCRISTCQSGYTKSGNSCVANTYTISYTLNGGTNYSGAPTSYNIATPTITLGTPTRTGYTFGGWYTSSTFSGSAVTSIPQGSTGNKTFYAKWTAKTYTITYNAGSGGTGSNQTQTVTYDDSFTTKAANTFTKANATFAGWSASSGSYPNASTSYTYTNVGNITLTATWTCNSGYTVSGTDCVETSTVTITLDPGLGTSSTGTSAIYVYGSNYYLNNAHTQQMTTSSNGITIPQRTNYTFTGYRGYCGTSYILMIDSNGKITSDALSCVSSLSYPTLTAGWNYSGPTGTYHINYAHSVTVWDQYSNTYSFIIRDAGDAFFAGGVPATNSDGQAFSGWCANNYYLAPGDVYTGGHGNDLTARYCGSSGGNAEVNAWVPSVSELINMGYQSNETDARIALCGSSFGSLLGATKCDTGYSMNTGTDNNIIGHYVVNGELVRLVSNCVEGRYMTSCTACTNKPSNSHYTASSSSLGGNCPWECDSGYVLSNNQCVFQDQCYTITLNNTTNGGTGGTTVLYKKSNDTKWYSDSNCATQVTTLTKPTKTNATYGGHYTSSSDGTQYVTNNGTLSTTWIVAENKTLYAQYDCNENYRQAGTRISGTCAANEHTVSFNANGGTGGQTADVTATYGAAMPAISTTAPTLAGYTFAGWYDNATSGTKYYNADGTSAKNWDKTANTTMYAHWTANSYTVSFNANGGTGGQTADVTATYGAAMPAISTTAPTRTGYTFKGWYDAASGGTKYYNANGTSARNWDKTINTTLYAQWAANTYTISFNTNGGTGGQTASVTATYGWAMPAISTTAPTRDGYTFTGWYDNGGILPSGYTQLEYIKSSGAQYIDTGVSFPTPDASIGINTKINYYNSTNSQSAWGAQTSGGSMTISPQMWLNATGTLWFYAGGKAGMFQITNFTRDRDYTFDISCSSGQCDFNDQQGTYGENFPVNRNLYLFASNYASANVQSAKQFAYIKMYYFRLTVNGILVRDFVPAKRNSDSVIGMYDTVSQTFFTNAGTGSFTAGPETSSGVKYYNADGTSARSWDKTANTTLYAQWAQDVITCTAGNYLPANSTSCATCPAGYYCPNTGNYVQSSSNQGIVSCASGKITETAGATSASQCKSPEFSMTTTSLAAGTVFSFTMSAKGNFVIDWGDGNIQQITRTNTTNTTYSHTYTTAGTYTIGMSGQATEYSTNTSIAAISFSGNTNIAGISGSLGAVFGTLSSGTNKQPRFYQTFANCSNLTGSIPSGLFSGISGAPVNQLFAYTFANCSGLTGSIPENLFSGVSGPLTNYLFTGTFMGCSGLTGFVPQNLFDGFTKTSASAPMYNVFNGTGLATACPAGYYQYITGFEADFNSKVACTPCPTGYTSGVGATANTGCYLTVDGGQVRDGTSGTTLSTCAAGTYKTSHNEYYGTSYSCDTCPTTNPYSPAGAADAGACGRKLHIGDNVMYLRSTQKTTPSLKFDFNKDGVADLFGNMSTSSKKMSSGVDKSFKVNYGGQVYYIHDDTVQ